jgi:hypothetical protein
MEPTYLEGGPNFVLEWCTPDALPILACPCGVPGLGNKGLYTAVEYAAVVIVGGAEGEKVLRRRR